MYNQERLKLMINFTNEEDAIFKKVELAYRQQDLCNLIKVEIIKDIGNQEFQKRVKKLKELLYKIQNISDYKEMQQYYEDKTNPAYWNGEILTDIIDDIIDDMLAKERNNQ